MLENNENNEECNRDTVTHHLHAQVFKICKVLSVYRRYMSEMCLHSYVLIVFLRPSSVFLYIYIYVVVAGGGGVCYS